MSVSSNALRSVVVEREFSHPPEKLWRALTQPQLIAEWLMNSDFRPEVGASFKFSESWGAVDCRVQTIEPNRTLAYSWDAFGLESVVTWTLTQTATGTRLRMEQAGFRQDQEQAFQGATNAWPRYFDAMGTVLAKLD